MSDEQEEEQKMYQFGESLRRLENRVEDNMNFQSKAFDNLNGTLKGIEKILSTFSNMSKEQTKQKIILKSVVDDLKEIKEFKSQSDCRTHGLEIKTLKENLSSKAESTTLLFNGFLLASFASSLTAFFTWLFTKT